MDPGRFPGTNCVSSTKSNCQFRMDHLADKLFHLSAQPINCFRFRHLTFAASGCFLLPRRHRNPNNFFGADFPNGTTTGRSESSHSVTNSHKHCANTAKIGAQSMEKGECLQSQSRYRARWALPVNYDPSSASNGPNPPQPTHTTAAISAAKFRVGR